MNEGIHFKSPEELSRQVDLAEEVLGALILPEEIDERNELIGGENAENRESAYRDVAGAFPYRYKAYLAALRENRALGKQVTEELEETSKQTYGPRLKAISNLEASTKKLGTEEQDVLLRESQYEVYGDLHDFFQTEKTRGYIQLPTGYGKTAIFSTLIGVTGLKTVVMVPLLDLVDQTADELAKFAPGLKVQAFKSGEKIDSDTDVVISCYQSKTPLKAALDEAPQQFEMVIHDEAHRVLSDAREEDVVDGIGAGKINIALTATLNLMSKKALSGFLRMRSTALSW